MLRIFRDDEREGESSISAAPRQGGREFTYLFVSKSLVY